MAHRIGTEQDAEKYESERYPVRVKGEKYRWFNSELDRKCKSIKKVERAKGKKGE